MLDKDKKSPKQDVHRLKKSFYYALKGIKEVLKREQNIKIQLVLTLVVILYGLMLQVGKVEFALLLLAIAQVLSLEIMNTGLEMYLDEKEQGHNESIGVIKDILAASVLVSVIFTTVVGLIIFFPPTLKMLGFS